MNTMRIHHIGYLVKKIDAAIKAFEGLGYTLSKPSSYDEIRKANIAFLSKDGQCVELVSPASEDSVVFNLLKKYKNSPYHICYESGRGNFEEDLEYLTSHGYTAIDTPTEAPCIDKRRVVFLMNSQIGIIELLES